MWKPDAATLIREEGTEKGRDDEIYRLHQLSPVDAG